MSSPALNKSETAYSQLRDRIRTREYEPGFRLVLSTLATEMGMSVVPVREAIRQLEAEGLVTYEKNVGARVSELNREAYFDTMETVAVLEGRATAASAPFLQEQDIAQAREINEQMRTMLNDFEPTVFTELNKKFHSLLFQHCPNKHLVELVHNEWERLAHFRVSTFLYVPQRAADSVNEHDRLIKLIEAGADSGYVEQVARSHRMATSDVYRKHIEQNYPELVKECQ